MKKLIGLIIFVLIIIFGVRFIKGRIKKLPESGMSFISLDEMPQEVHAYMNDEQLAFYEGKKGYICVLEKNAPENIVIPDEYEGEPVYIATTRKHLTANYKDCIETKVKSVQIGKNVDYICCFLNEGVIGEMEELIIPENVTDIDQSFSSLKGTRVVIEGEPSLNHAFEYSQSIVIETSTDAEMLEAGNDITGIDYDFETLENNYYIVSSRIDDYTGDLDREKLLEWGKSHFCERLDNRKKINANRAKDYALFLDGPIVTMRNCPDINAEDYMSQSPTFIANKVDPVVWGIEITAMKYPDEMYEYEDGETAKVYFLVEKTGGTGVSYGIQIADQYYGTTEVDYYMSYRISVRDIETDELICWFETQEGYAPETKEQGRGSMEELGRHYLLDEDRNATTPFYCVHKYFNEDYR